MSARPATSRFERDHATSAIAGYLDGRRTRHPQRAGSRGLDIVQHPAQWLRGWVEKVLTARVLAREARKPMRTFSPARINLSVWACAGMLSCAVASPALAGTDSR